MRFVTFIFPQVSDLQNYKTLSPESSSVFLFESHCVSIKAGYTLQGTKISAQVWEVRKIIDSKVQVLSSVNKVGIVNKYWWMKMGREIICPPQTFN